MKHCDPGVGTPEDDLAQVVGVLLSNHDEIEEAKTLTGPLPSNAGIVCAAMIKVNGVTGTYGVLVVKVEDEND